MGVAVFYPSPMNASICDALEELLDPGVALVRNPSDTATCQILIDGRPSAELLDRLASLRAVIVPFAGVPKATLDLLSARPQLSLHNLHHNSAETAETALALLFAAAKRVVPMDSAMRNHDWSARYGPSTTVRLEGKTVLILGFGHIGRRIGEACQALGMRVIGIRRDLSEKPGSPAISPSPFPTSFDVPPSTCEIQPVEKLRQLLPKAQVLVVSLPQTPETEGLIGGAELGLLPPNAILVNVARAEIVDEQALFDALKSGRLHSAGLDVWYRYPPADEAAKGKDESAVTSYFRAPESAKNTPPSRFPFHELENVVMSPHRGGASSETEARRVEHLAQMLNAFSRDGAIPNRVNLELGY